MGILGYFTSGSDFQTLPILIYSMTKKEVKPDIYALSTLIIITILVLEGEQHQNKNGSVKYNKADGDKNT